ncbi:MAG: FtsH protease activity modulator HflK [Sphingomicrobium sp.]
MSILSGLGARARGLFNDTKGPWGPTGGDQPPPDDGGSGGPWGEPPKRGRRTAPASSGNIASFEEFVRRSKARFGGDGGGGGGGGFFGRPDRSIFLWGLLALVLVWLVSTTFHSIAPEERGVVTRFGRYYTTLGPGVGLTLPSPIDRVRKLDVENIRVENLPSQPDAMMLTGDQNILDIDYSVRWNIRDPELFMFELSDPQETIRQVAESAMRAVIARVSLKDAMGDRRGQIEGQVMEAVQRVLDGYRSGVLVQGVAIKRADPPEPVNAAFKEVSAAQQDAQRYVSQANSYAQQLTFKAEGEAGAFDKVYEQYKLAPEVTRRRMYYETMEEVLRRVDKTIIEAPGVMPYLPLPQPQKAPPPADAAQ